MKKINIIVLVLVLAMSQAFGQTAYNPFTQNIHFVVEPTAQGFECNTIQTVEFTQGLTTIDDATQWQNNPLTVTICLTGFTFNGPASTAITGDYAQNFDWAYDSFAPNCVIGTQNRPLPGTGNDPFFPNPASTGSILASLKVPETSPIGTVLAVNVNLQVPGYMSQFNSTPDDNEATQTQTFCPLKIKGNVFMDTTLVNNTVDGSPISRANDTTLYAHLVDPSGNVIAITTIATDGTYEFTNVLPSTTYQVVLSMNQGTIGQLPPAVELPSQWQNVNEDCCDKLGTDGTNDGKTIVVVDKATVLDVNFGIFSPNPLPLVLSYFFVTENKCSALLSWSTLQEQNTDKVEVYRKDNAASPFAKIATVKLAGTSSSTLVYSYVDNKITNQAEAYQYKLNFVDLDGKSSMSDVVSLKLNCAVGNASVNVFPNPVSSDLTVLYVTDSREATLDFDIVDVTGRKVLSETHNVQSGSTVIPVNVKSLAVGTYYLRYNEYESSNNGTIKFMKQ